MNQDFSDEEREIHWKEYIRIESSLSRLSAALRGEMACIQNAGCFEINEYYDLWKIEEEFKQIRKRLKLLRKDIISNHILNQIPF